MGIWILLSVLWTAMYRLCALVQLIMLLERHRNFMVILWQKWESVWPKLRENKDFDVVPVVLGLGIVGVLVVAYYLLTGLFALGVGVHRYVSPTLVVALLMSVWCISLHHFLTFQIGDHQHRLGKDGWTPQNLLLAGIFVLVVAINVLLGLSYGTIVAIVVSLLVVAFTYVEHENYCDGRQGWTPQVDGDKFCGLLFGYYVLSGVLALLMAILSFSGLSSETYFTLAVGLLLVAKYTNCGRLSWSDARPLVVPAVVIYVLWKVLFALAVAINLSAWLSSEAFFKLVLASLMLVDVLNPTLLPTIIGEVSTLLERISH